MKKIKYILISFSLLFIFSCNESTFLKENPLDFYSPENSMVTNEDFQTSLNYLYNRVRHMQWALSHDSRYALRYATDFAFNATDYHVPGKLNDYTNNMVPTFGPPADVWNLLYGIVSNANVILNRLTLTDQVSESDEISIRGEALFFRAYGHQVLAHLYGGVPLVLEEVDSPRRDYVRAGRNEVYTQNSLDLQEAVSLLSDIDNVKDGKISKQMAQHLLAETYICLGKYQEAVQMANHVINHSSMGLMTQRFGSRLNEERDVYWDLFRVNNQNRSSGNRESLWVLQYDYQNAGSSETLNSSFCFLPQYGNLVLTLPDENGEEVTKTLFAGITDMKGGNGVGWMQPTTYFFYGLWGNDFNNDIRNSSHNIIRDVKIDNPESPAFGKWLVADGYSKQLDTIRYWFPIMTKVVRIGNYPEEFYQKDSDGSPLMTAFGEHILLSGTNSSYKDEYMCRLAETYLLRAEAYLGLGDLQSAANDINVIRARANATPATASEIDMDYILDERMRELYLEEMRMVTLTRTSKLVDRNRKYNPKTGATISDHHNVWPIPYSEIERNVYNVLEQNPGY